MAGDHRMTDTDSTTEYVYTHKVYVDFRLDMNTTLPIKQFFVYQIK